MKLGRGDTIVFVFDIQKLDTSNLLKKNVILFWWKHLTRSGTILTFHTSGWVFWCILSFHNCKQAFSLVLCSSVETVFITQYFVNILGSDCTCSIKSTVTYQNSFCINTQLIHGGFLYIVSEECDSYYFMINVYCIEVLC